MAGRGWEWLRRYAPAEAAATAGATVAALAAHRLGVPTATAFAAAIGENLAFYAVILLRDLYRGPRRNALRRLLIEFGPAEVLDTFAVRPLAMYLATVLVGPLLLAVVLGKVVADVVFYGLAIVGYELGRSTR